MTENFIQCMCHKLFIQKCWFPTSWEPFNLRNVKNRKARKKTFFRLVLFFYCVSWVSNWFRLEFVETEWSVGWFDCDWNDTASIMLLFMVWMSCNIFESTGDRWWHYIDNKEKSNQFFFSSKINIRNEYVCLSIEILLTWWRCWQKVSSWLESINISYVCHLYWSSIWSSVAVEEKYLFFVNDVSTQSHLVSSFITQWMPSRFNTCMILERNGRQVHFLWRKYHCRFRIRSGIDHLVGCRCLISRLERWLRGQHGEVVYDT